MENTKFRGIEFLNETPVSSSSRDPSDKSEVRENENTLFLYFIIIMLICVIVILQKTHSDHLAKLALVSSKAQVF